MTRERLRFTDIAEGQYLTRTTFGCGCPICRTALPAWPDSSVRPCLSNIRRLLGQLLQYQAGSDDHYEAMDLIIAMQSREPDFQLTQIYPSNNLYVDQPSRLNRPNRSPTQVYG